MITRRVLTGLLVIAVPLWLTTILTSIQPEQPSGGDFYQLYLGAGALLDGELPYTPSITTKMQLAYGVWGVHGLPYPIAGLIPIVPLALLPLTLAIGAYLVLSFSGLATFILTRRDWQILAIAMLLSPALVRVIGLSQPTLLWTAFAALLVVATERRWAGIGGLMLAILPAKPQTGLIFAVMGAVWAWRNYRSMFAWGTAWAVVLWLGPFMVFPTWAADCLTIIGRYANLYPQWSLLPWGVVLIALTYRQPWWAVAAVAQVLLFPIRDLYTLTPLLIAWAALGGRQALFAALIAQSMVLLPFGFLPRIWIGTMLPLGVSLAGSVIGERATTLQHVHKVLRWCSQHFTNEVD